MKHLSQQVTPLAMALAFNHHSIVKVIASYHQKRNDDHNTKALTLAVKQKRTENSNRIIDILLTHEANPLGLNDDDQETSPIIQAIGRDDCETIKRFLDTGISVNALVRSDGTSMLMIAALNNKINTARLLVDENANVDIFTASSEGPISALTLAIKENYHDIAELLIPRCKDPQHIRQVLKSPHNENLKQLLKTRYATLLAEELTAKKANALSSFLQAENELEAQALIDTGFDVILCDQNGWTALMHAVSGNRKDLASVLLHHNAPCYTKQKSYEALKIALDQNNKPMLELLKEHNIDIESLIIFAFGNDDENTITEYLHFMTEMPHTLKCSLKPQLLTPPISPVCAKLAKKIATHGATVDPTYLSPFCSNDSCIKESKSKCPCLQVAYCGTSCQKAHRKTHKISCTAQKAQSNTNAPVNNNTQEDNAAAAVAKTAAERAERNREQKRITESQQLIDALNAYHVNPTPETAENLEKLITRGWKLHQTDLQHQENLLAALDAIAGTKPKVETLAERTQKEREQKHIRESQILIDAVSAYNTDQTRETLAALQSALHLCSLHPSHKQHEAAIDKAIETMNQNRQDKRKKKTQKGPQSDVPAPHINATVTNQHNAAAAGHRDQQLEEYTSRRARQNERSAGASTRTSPQGPRHATDTSHLPTAQQRRELLPYDPTQESSLQALQPREGAITPGNTDNTQSPDQQKLIPITYGQGERKETFFLDLKHLFDGEPGYRGLHHDRKKQFAMKLQNAIEMPITITMNKQHIHNGCYTITGTGDDGQHIIKSFFPISWDKKEVKKKIDEALKTGIQFFYRSERSNNAQCFFGVIKHYPANIYFKGVLFPGSKIIKTIFPITPEEYADEQRLFNDMSASQEHSNQQQRSQRESRQAQQESQRPSAQTPPPVSAPTEPEQTVPQEPVTPKAPVSSSAAPPTMAMQPRLVSQLNPLAPAWKPEQGAAAIQPMDAKYGYGSDEKEADEWRELQMAIDAAVAADSLSL